MDFENYQFFLINMYKHDECKKNSEITNKYKNLKLKLRKTKKNKNSPFNTAVSKNSPNNSIHFLR
jgi:hypothetical protein